MKTTHLILPLLIFLAGCATRGEMSSAFQDIEELKTRLDSTEKNIAAVRSESREIAEKSSRDALKSLETLRKGTADMQANLDAMRIDVQVMTGKLDDIGLAAKKPFDDITLLKEDTSKSVSAMEERLKKLESDLAVTNEKLSSIVKSLEAPPTAENLYKQAQDAIKAGEPGKAREILSKFNETYPEHKLSPNVRYWIGETWYMEKNYEQAVLEFQRVIKEYPGKEKVSAAMLKQAMAFKEMGDLKSAKFVLKELIEKFPLSEEIPAAKEHLGKIK
jgi:tol-pal system protein YbgF